MANGLKRLGISIVALVGCVLAAFALVSVLVDRARVIDAVESQIRAATGLDLVLRGNAEVSLFPNGAVSFRDVVLKGDSQDDPALTVSDITANLRLLPLLAGRFEIADVTLVGARMAVTRKEDGATNWSGIIETLARTLKPGPDSPVSFSEIRIKDGLLIYHDRVRGLQDTFGGIDLSVAWPSISRTFGATGQFTWNGQRIDGSVALGDFVAALSGQQSPLKIRLAGAPLKFAFDGSLANAATLMMEGTLSADAPSLRDILAWAHRDPPPTGFNRFALKAKVNVVGSSINLSNVNLELDGNVAEGVLSFSGDGRQTLQGTLAAESLNLTPYIGSVRSLTTNARNWSRQPLDLMALTGFDLDMRLSAASVNLGSSKLGRTALSVNLNSGALTLSVGEAQVFGGLGRGSLVISPSEDKAAVQTQFQFSDVNLEACLAELFGIRKLSGRGNLNVALDASGTNAYELAQSLGGTAALSGRDGALNGFNIEQLLRRLERRPLSGTADFRNGSTAFKTLDITLRFVDGIATSEDSRMEGPTVRVTMVGTASVPNRELDLKGTAGLVAAAETTAFELPFVVQGLWDDPMILPDPEILLRRSPASAPLFNSVRERRARDAIRGALERLTGGNASSAAPAPAGEATPPAPAETAPRQ